MFDSVIIFVFFTAPLPPTEIRTAEVGTTSVNLLWDSVKGKFVTKLGNGDLKHLYCC